MKLPSSGISHHHPSENYLKRITDPSPRRSLPSFPGANMLVEMGLTSADGWAFHDGLGRGVGALTSRDRTY